MLGTFSIAEVPLCTSDLLTHYVLVLDVTSTVIEENIYDIDRGISTNSTNNSFLPKQTHKIEFSQLTNSSDITKRPGKVLQVISNDISTFVKHTDTHFLVESVSIGHALKVIDRIISGDMIAFAEQFNEINKNFTLSFDSSSYILNYTDKHLTISADSNADIKKLIDIIRLKKQSGVIYFDKQIQIERTAFSLLEIISVKQNTNTHINANSSSFLSLKTLLDKLVTTSKHAVALFSKDIAKSVQYRAISDLFIVFYIRHSISSFSSYSANMSKLVRMSIFESFWNMIDLYQNDISKKTNLQVVGNESIDRNIAVVFGNKVFGHLVDVVKNTNKKLLGLSDNQVAILSKDIETYVITYINTQHDVISKQVIKSFDLDLTSVIDINKISNKLISQYSLSQLSLIKEFIMPIYGLSLSQSKLKRQIDRTIDKSIQAQLSVINQTDKTFDVSFSHQIYLNIQAIFNLVLDLVSSTFSSMKRNSEKNVNIESTTTANLDKNISKIIISAVLNNSLIIKTKEVGLFLISSSAALSSLIKDIVTLKFFDLNHSSSISKSSNKEISDYSLITPVVIKDINKELREYFVSDAAISKLTRVEINQISVTIKHIAKYIDVNLASDVLSLVKQTAVIDKEFFNSFNQIVNLSKNIDKEFLESLQSVITVSHSIDSKLLLTINSMVSQLKNTHTTVDTQSNILVNAVKSTIKYFDLHLTAINSLRKDISTSFFFGVNHYATALRNIIHSYVVNFSHISSLSIHSVFQLILSTSSNIHSSISKSLSKSIRYLSFARIRFDVSNYLHLFFDVVAGHNTFIFKESIKDMLVSLSNNTLISSALTRYLLIMTSVGNVITTNKYLSKSITYISQSHSLLWRNLKGTYDLFVSWLEKGFTKTASTKVTDITDVPIEVMHVTNIPVSIWDTTEIKIDI